METIDQVLKYAGAVKNQYTADHAKKLIAIYNLLREESGNIVKTWVEPKEMNFGRITEREFRGNEWHQVVKYTGVKMAGQCITVETFRGRYEATVPDKPEILHPFYDLLGIDYAKPKTERPLILQYFTLPAAAMACIKTARTFSSKDTLRENLCVVAIEINDNQAQIIGTDGHQLYYSRKLSAGGPAGNFTILIKTGTLAKLPKVTDDTFELVVYEGNTADMAGMPVELYSGSAFPQWKYVVPETTGSMVFNRAAFAQNIKAVMPSGNKNSNLISLTLNGKIDIHAEDVDMGTESSAQMVYEQKTFPDMQIGFNGKYLLSAMQVFKAKELTVLSNGNPKKGMIFTDGIDNLMVLPILLNVNDEPESVPEIAETVPEPAETVTELPERVMPAPAAPVVQPKRKGVIDTTDKAVLIYSCRVESWIKEGYTVVVHSYPGKMVIRYIKPGDGGMFRGERKIQLPEYRLKKLEDAIYQVGKQRRKDILRVHA